MATEAGAAYVRILPSLKGFGAALAREVPGTIQKPAEKEGQAAGKKAGGGFGASFKRGLAGAGGAMALFGGVGFLQNAFKDALDRAALPVQLKNQFGLTAAVSKQAADTAGKLYAQGWGASLTDISKAVGQTQRELQTLGSKEDLARITTQAQAMADTFGQEVNPLVRSASQLVKTGLAPSMEAAFDAMTRGFQAGGDSGEDLLDTLNEYAGQFQKLGIDAPTALGLMNQALQAGARDSDYAADALKEFSIRAVDGSKTTKDAFKSLGLNADQMAQRFAKGGKTASNALALTMARLKGIKDPVVQSQAAVGLFGTKAEDLGAALYAMNPALVATTGGMNNVKGAAQGVTDEVGGTLQSSLTALGNTFKTALGDALVNVTPLLQGLLTFLAPITPILGPLAIAIGGVTAAVWLFNTALKDNPIGIIVTLIAGFVAAIMHLWKTNEGFRSVVIAIWNGIKATIGAVVAAIKAIFNAFVAAGKAVWTAMKAVGQGVAAAWKWMGDMIGRIGRWIGDRVRDVAGFFRELPGKIGGFIRKVVDVITWPFKKAFNAIAGLWNNTLGRISFTIPDWVPLIGGKHFGIPKIPTLAEGGVVQATPGGVLAMIGEGGQDEAVIPLDRLSAMMGAAAATGSGGASQVQVYIDATGLPRGLEQWLRSSVRVKGGTVQTAYGRVS